MRVRRDFVTNSSSSSYIVIIKHDDKDKIIDNFIQNNSEAISNYVNKSFDIEEDVRIQMKDFFDFDKMDFEGQIGLYDIYKGVGWDNDGSPYGIISEVNDAGAKYSDDLKILCRIGY